MRDLRMRFGVILAAALLPLLLLSIWRSFADHEAGRALIRSNTDLTARIALNEATNSINVTKLILRYTTSLLSDENCPPRLPRLIEEYPKLFNILHFNHQNKLVCSAKDASVDEAVIRRFLDKLTPHEPFISEVVQLGTLGDQPQSVLLSAYGTYEKDNLLSVSVAVENIQNFLDPVEDSKSLMGSELAIFSRDGRVIGGNWGSHNLQKIVKSLPLAQLEGELITTDGHGHPLLIVPTPAENLYIGVASQEQDFGSLGKFNPLLSAAIPIFAWIFGFAAIWLATDQIILIHLRRMRRATVAFAKGERNARVGTLKNPPHSIAALGKNFDIMADRIVEREAAITDSLDEKETLLREIHHRVKNNLQIIISLLNMQERKLTDTEGLAAISETRSRISAIALVHRGLYESADLRFVNMQTFLDRLLSELALAFGFEQRDITVSTIANCDPMEADTATPVALFVVEAVTNAAKHGVNGGGEIDILIQQMGDEIQVSISDTGHQLTEVAKPHSSGIGTKLMKGFARQLDGKLSKSQDEAGFRTCLTFMLRRF